MIRLPVIICAWRLSRYRADGVPNRGFSESAGWTAEAVRAGAGSSRSGRIVWSDPVASTEAWPGNARAAGTPAQWATWSAGAGGHDGPRMGGSADGRVSAERSAPLAPSAPTQGLRMDKPVASQAEAGASAWINTSPAASLDDRVDLDLFFVF